MNGTGFGRAETVNVGMFARQTGWQAAARGGGLLAGMTATGIVARAAPTRVFAVYGVAVLVAAVVSASADFGLSTVGTTRLAGTDGRLLGGLVRLRVQTSGLLAAAVVLTAGLVGWWSPLTGVAVGVGGLSAAVSAAGSACLAGPVAAVRFDIPARADLAGQVAGVVGVAVAVTAGAHLAAVVGTVLLAGLVRAAVAAVLTVRAGLFAWDRFTPTHRAGIVRAAAPMAVWNIVGTASLRAGPFVVYLLRGPAAFAPYALVFRGLDVMLVAPGLVLAAALPLFAVTARDNLDRYHRLVQRFTDLLWPAGFAAGTLLAVAAPTVVDVLGGGRYPAAVTVLRISAVAGIAVWGNTLAVTAAAARHLQTPAVRVATVALAVAVTAAAGLVTVIGPLGGAVGSVVGETAMAIGVGRVVYRGQPTPRWAVPARAAAVAAVAATAGLFTETRTGTGVAVGVSVGLLAVGYRVARIPHLHPRPAGEDRPATPAARAPQTARGTR